MIFFGTLLSTRIPFSFFCLQTLQYLGRFLPRLSTLVPLPSVCSPPLFQLWEAPFCPPLPSFSNGFVFSAVTWRILFFFSGLPLPHPPPPSGFFYFPRSLLLFFFVPHRPKVFKRRAIFPLVQIENQSLFPHLVTPQYFQTSRCLSLATPVSNSSLLFLSRSSRAESGLSPWPSFLLTVTPPFCVLVRTTISRVSEFYSNSTLALVPS